MIRALNALTGLLLTAVGLIVTFSTGNVDGWTVLAAVGVCQLGADLYIEQREADRANR